MPVEPELLDLDRGGDEGRAHKSAVEQCVPLPAKGRHRHTTSGLRLFSGDLPRPCRRLAAAVPELHRVRHSPHDPQADCCDRSSWEHRLDDLHPSGHEHPAECHVDDHDRSDQDHRRLVGHSGQKLHRHAAPRRHQEMTKAPASLPGLPALQLNSTSRLSMQWD